MQDYRTLRVWQRAHALTLDVYRATMGLRRYGHASLVSQTQRAAVSIGANIAEGCGRAGNRELAKFLQIAMASAHELEYHLLLSADLGLLARRDHARLAESTATVKKMLTMLLRRVREGSRLAETTPPEADQPSQETGDRRQ